MKTDLKNTTMALRVGRLSNLQFLNQHGSIQLFTQSFGPLEVKVLKRFVLAMGNKENIAEVDMKLVDKNLLHKVCEFFIFFSKLTFIFELFVESLSSSNKFHHHFFIALANKSDSHQYIC